MLFKFTWDTNDNPSNKNTNMQIKIIIVENLVITSIFLDVKYNDGIINTNAIAYFENDPVNCEWKNTVNLKNIRADKEREIIIKRVLRI